MSGPNLPYSAGLDPPVPPAGGPALYLDDSLGAQR